MCIPLELIVSGNLLDIPDHSSLDDFRTLLDFIPWDPRQRTVDIHLGSFKYNDPFGWGSYIEGRKRKFETLCARYGPIEDYDIGRIRADLEYLLSLKVYTGKYPNFAEQKAFDSYEIIEGPGSRRTFFEMPREYLLKQGHAETEIEELQRIAEKEWVTIRLNGVSRFGKEAILFFLVHADHHITFLGSLMRQCDRCVAMPQKANQIPPNAFKLTSKFFWHFKPSDDESIFEEALPSPAGEDQA